jgi:hypothetical protein
MEIMEVTLIRENEDGSSDYTIEVTLKEKEDLIRFAIMFMLKQIIEEGQLYDPSESSLDNPGGRNKDSVHGKSKQSRKSTQYSHGPEAA